MSRNTTTSVYIHPDNRKFLDGKNKKKESFSTFLVKGAVEHHGGEFAYSEDHRKKPKNKNK